MDRYPFVRRQYHKWFYDPLLTRREARHIDLRFRERQLEIQRGMRNELSFEILHRLTPQAIGSVPTERIGGSSDGSYVVPCSDFGAATLLSLGVGNLVNFEIDMLARGLSAVLVDGTVQDPCLGEKSTFLQAMVGTGMDQITIDDLFRTLDLEGQSVVMSVDIEGAEWEAFHSDSLSDKNMRCIPWFTIELHEIQRLFLVGREAERMFQTLERILSSFQSVFVSVNNSAKMVDFDSGAVPPVVEVTFVRRDLIQTGLPASKLAPIRNAPLQPPISWPYGSN